LLLPLPLPLDPELVGAVAPEAVVLVVLPTVVDVVDDEVSSPVVLP
jgi:hypothetical protein